MKKLYEMTDSEIEEELARMDVDSYRDDELTEFVLRVQDHIQNTSKENFTYEGEDFPAHLFLDTPGGFTVSLVPQFFTDDLGKRTFGTSVLPKLIRMQGATRWALATSTWVVHPSDMEAWWVYQRVYQTISMEGFKFKRERVVLTAGEWSGEIGMWSCEIIREPGAAPQLGPWENGWRLTWSPHDEEIKVDAAALKRTGPTEGESLIGGLMIDGPMAAVTGQAADDPRPVLALLDALEGVGVSFEELTRALLVDRDEEVLEKLKGIPPETLEQLKGELSGTGFVFGVTISADGEVAINHLIDPIEPAPDPRLDTRDLDPPG